MTEALPAGASVTITTAEEFIDTSLDLGQVEGPVEVSKDPLGSPSILGAPTTIAIEEEMECELPGGIKRKARSSPEDAGEDYEVNGARFSRARKTRVLGDESDVSPDGGDRSSFGEHMTLRSGKICIEDSDVLSSSQKVITEIVLDTIVLENSSGDDDFVVPNKVKKKLTKKKIKSKPGKPLRKAQSTSNLAGKRAKMAFEDLDNRFSTEDLLAKGAPSLGSKGFDYVSEVESMRASSSNLSGRFNGKMKDYLLFAKEVIRALVEKVETTGDVSRLRIRNHELSEELKESKIKEVRMQKEIDDLHNAILDLRREIRALKNGGVFSSQGITDSRHKTRRDNNVVVPVEDAPDCSKDQEYMSRGLDWGTDSGTLWVAPISPNINAASSDREVRSIINDPVNKRERVVKVEPIGKRIDIIREGISDLPNRGLPQRPLGARKNIKVVANIQVAPPRSRINQKQPKLDHSIIDSNREDDKWKTVGKGGRGIAREPFRIPGNSDSRGSAPGTPGAKNKINKGNRKMSGGAVGPGKRWTPKPALITITRNSEEFSYARILSTAREKVSLKNIGITKTKIRKAANGGYIIEVPGSNDASLANSQQEKLKTALNGMARINKPTALSELRIVGIDPSTSVDEIRRVLSLAGKCSAGDFKVSNVNLMRDGMGVVWVRCPSATAYTIAGLGRIERIELGWTTVRIDLLKKKPV